MGVSRRVYQYMRCRAYLSDEGAIDHVASLAGLATAGELRMVRPEEWLAIREREPLNMDMLESMNEAIASGDYRSAPEIYRGRRFAAYFAEHPQHDLDAMKLGRARA